MKKRYSEEQIIGFLKAAEGGVPTKELGRRHGFSEASFYTWRSRYGGMDVSDAKRPKALETENTRLKKPLAESMLEIEVTPEALRKSGSRTGATRGGVLDAGTGIVGAAGTEDRENERELVALCTGARLQKWLLGWVY